MRNNIFASLNEHPIPDMIIGDNWLKLPMSRKFDDIKELLDFDIVGEEDIKYLIWFLKLGDNKKETRNFVSLSGISSSGKSLNGGVVVKNLPGDQFLIFDSISKSALSRDEELQSGKHKSIFYREFRRDTSVTEDLKAGFDKETVRKVTERDEMGNWVVKNLKTVQFGLLTTHSLDWIPQDLKDRCWNLTSDTSFEQSERIVDFILKNERTKIERDILREGIDEKRKIVLKGIKRLNWNLTPIIPYSEQLKPLLSIKNIRIRRDITKLIQLIHIITLVNQKNRYQKAFFNREGIETKRYIISEYEDLQYALKIGKRFFLETIQNLDQIQIELLSQMDIKGKVKTTKHGSLILNEKGSATFENYKLKDLISFLEKKFSNETTIYKMKKHTQGLRNEGYIEIYEKGKGKSTEYKKIKNFENLQVDLQVNFELICQITEQYIIGLEPNTLKTMRDEIKIREEMKENIDLDNSILNINKELIEKELKNTNE